MSKKQIGILGTGVYVPEAVLSNEDLEKMVETSSEWIVDRSGILERRIAAPDEDTVSMAVLAGRQALANAGIEPEQLSYIVLGTNTPPHFFPRGPSGSRRSWASAAKRRPLISRPAAAASTTPCTWRSAWWTR